MGRILVPVLLAALCTWFIPSTSQARDSGPTPPRLGFVDGEVSFWRPGAEDWTPAQVNTALAEGDELYAGSGANLEVQVGPRAFVRASDETQIGLDTLDDDLLQFKLTAGHAAFDLQRLPRGQRFEVDTPGAAFTFDRPGYYRVDVDDQNSSFVVRRGGLAHVVAANGEESDLGEDQRVVLASADAGPVQPQVAAAVDEWDRWNYDRTGQLAETPRSAQYVSSDVAGVDDLDRYGDWRDEPKYGHVWVPRGVDTDWAPYSTGRWVYDPSYEWTWVDDAPWGWAPYHYGRWVNFGGDWGWAPGPVVAAPVYAPALVAFFGVPGIGVSVSVGAPVLSWCALGWGEPVIPWWGGGGFVGTPYWGGWGGPRVVNNVVINNTTIVNAQSMTHFQNASVRHALIGVERGRFGRGGAPVGVEPGRLQLVHGRLGVQPAAVSLAPRGGHGRRPPERFEHRSVVATREPRDPVHRLRERGVETAAAPVARPQTRLVHPHGGGRADRALTARETAQQNARAGTPPKRPGFDRGMPGRHPDERLGAVPHAPQPPRNASRNQALGQNTPPPTPRGQGGGHAFGRAVPPPPPGGGHGHAFDRTPPPPPAERRSATRDFPQRGNAPQPPRNASHDHGLGQNTPPPAPRGQGGGRAFGRAVSPPPPGSGGQGHAFDRTPPPPPPERRSAARDFPQRGNFAQRGNEPRPAAPPRHDMTQRDLRVAPGGQPAPRREAPHRVTPNVPRDAMPTPLPRGDQSRFVRPDNGMRSARRETTFDQPAMRGPRPEPQMHAAEPRMHAPEQRMRAPEHRAPAPERRSRPQDGRNHPGHGA